jgi:hypothetical protein
MRKSWSVTPVLLVALLLAVVGATVQGAGVQATTITVTGTGDDYNDGWAQTCSGNPTEPCTLRRAINEAHGVGTQVNIEFDIPNGDPGYNPTLGVWKIKLTGTTGDDLRELDSAINLDGSTQQGGRPDGPKIIVDGQGNHNRGLVLYDANEVRGLAMQDFLDGHIVISGDGNLVEDCWFGLSDDGMTLSSGSDTEPEGGSGVWLTATADQNTIRDNLFAGFVETAAAIRGQYNDFVGNWIGLRADGTVPIPTQFDKHPCQSGAWTGGSGITVADDSNTIGGPTAADGNVFAGLFLDVAAGTTQGPAMDVGGDLHNIQFNVIGLDAHGDVVGVCGRGIDMGNAPANTAVTDNTIVEPGLSAMLLNGSTLNGITLWHNTIKRESQWPGAQGFNPFPEDAIAYGTTAPAALKGFAPAKITDVSGTTVSGTSGDGSFCPLCKVELFLDDTDGVTEALQPLVMVTANASGNWQATLPAPLEGGQGLRTMSTVPDDFTIVGLDEDTTSNLSHLQAAIYQAYLPIVLR